MTLTTPKPVETNAVTCQTMRAQNLVTRPGSLMTPAMIVRALVAARRSPVSRRKSDAGPGETPDRTHLDAHAAVTHVARQWSLR